MTQPTSDCMAVRKQDISSLPRWLTACALCLLPLLVLLPDHAGAASAPCPASVVDQLDGLYRWQVARQDERGPIDLSSQRGRFTPGLDQQLRAAHQLNPADGRFVDFDVFSGTQVRTFGARVLGCAPADQGGLEARVAVQVGLGKRPADAPVLLRYRLVAGPSGAWRIADITYPGEPAFRLSSFLSELLDIQRNGDVKR
ncbi:hypothetical protein [Synechococcus sp. RedBA-s]|uniref:hypothetical protein n=1 Tax=Synechococcus sp. RedBA-s TaxID=2823741 RepID=UPI0020CE7FFC|nr:hypothetical protein [Synechococcus sp. RedBA-s]